MTPDNAPYDRVFFDGQSARSLQSARIVLGKLFPLLRPRRVLDVGCGIGTWMRAALELGADDVLGTDGDYVDPAQLLVDPALFVAGDLAAHSVRDVLGPRAENFDLVVCMEVAEHLPFARAPSLVAELTGLTDAVLFSAAVPFQFGTAHINEQWPEFWAILFRAQGFSCYNFLRADIWADDQVEWWYQQNALVFARDGSAAAGALPQAARADSSGLAVVHPENLLANLLGLPRRHRQDAAREEMEDLRSIVAAHLRGDRVPPSLSAPGRAARSNADARNVFPWTRTDIFEPEREIADLSHALGEARTLLSAAELAHGAERAEHAVVRAALDAERAARRDAQVFADATQARAQAFAAARLHAQTRIAELIDVDVARQAELAALRTGLAAPPPPEPPPLEAPAPEPTVVAAEEAPLPEPAPLPAPAPLGVPQRAVRRLRLLNARLPAPVRRTTRLAYRTLRPLPPAVPAPEPPAFEPEPPPVKVEAIEPSPEAEMPEAAPAPPEKKEIKCFDRVLGEVNWWTLAAAVTRLHRFEMFDAAAYTRRNPDVLAAGLDPYAHFLQSGALEGRGRVDPEELARLMSGLLLFDNAVRALPSEPGTDADLAALVADVGHVGVYVSSHGNMFMEEIASDFAADLRQVGVRVDLLDETAPIDGRPPVCLFVAPHEFFILGRGPEWVRDDVFSDGFMFGTEQVQTTWFQTALPFVMMSRGMLDLCAQTADLFDRTNMASLHVLPGARLRPHTLTDEDRRHALFGVLPASARGEPDPHRAFADRPIDISFFGTSSPRRDRFFATNARFLAEYETFSYSRRSGRGPIRKGGEDDVLTRLAGHVSGHSKITLNIHREEFGYFEWHRMVRLGMCSGSVVVSDPCLPDPDFIAGQHYFQAPARQIPDLLEWLLTTEDGGQAAERVRANVDALITHTFDTRHTVARTLRFLSKHRNRE